MTTKDSKRRNGIILVLVAAVLLLIAGGVGIYLLNRDTGTDDPNAAASRFTDAYQRGLNSSGRDVQVSEFEPVVCSADLPALREAFSAKENAVAGQPQFKLSVKDVKTNGDKGSFTVDSKISVAGTDDQSADENFTLVKENGDWKVCGFGS